MVQQHGSHQYTPVMLAYIQYMDPMGYTYLSSSYPYQLKFCLNYILTLYLTFYLTFILTFKIWHIIRHRFQVWRRQQSLAMSCQLGITLAMIWMLA